MDEHTPGPWMIDPGWTLFTHELWGRVQYPTISHAKVGNVAYVVPKVDGRRDATGEANARLIAAAPDLLRECRAIKAQLDRVEEALREHDGSDLSNTSVSFAVEPEGRISLDAAIAKAEGRT